MVTELLVKMTLTKSPNRLKSFFQFFYYFLEGLLLFFIPRSWRQKRFKDVHGQIVLVTGGGSGLGQLTALKFLKLGATVVIWDINQDGLNQTKQMAQKEHQQQLRKGDVKLHSYRIDLSNNKSISETAERVRKDVGPVDILVNNAGVVNGENILDLSDEKISWVFKVNAMAHFFTIKAFLPSMIERKRGHIVTVASLCGEFGVALLSDYCASKFANIGMEQSLRMELAKVNLTDQIKTTIVKPWLITTGMFAKANSGVLPFLQPEMVAQRIVEAILQEELVLVLPWYLEYFVPLVAFLPAKCLIAAYDFFGGFESMDNFEGRREQKSQKLTK